MEKIDFDEEFKNCPFNTSLEVSQYGIVRKKGGEILKRGVYKDKYFIVEDPSGKRQFELVHRLVAITWKNEGYEKGKRLFVHHIDSNGFNNNKDNLVWMNACVHAMACHGAEIECDNCIEKEKCELCFFYEG